MSELDVRREEGNRTSKPALSIRRTLALLWLFAFSTLVLTHMGTIPWRCAFVVRSAFEYPDRIFDSYLWRASWGMSGDMTYGDVEGYYMGFEAEGLLGGVLLIATTLMGRRFRRVPDMIYFPAILAFLFLWTQTLCGFMLAGPEAFLYLVNVVVAGKSLVTIGDWFFRKNPRVEDQANVDKPSIATDSQ